jgi:glycosyltransferase involved in cell wall biosynthesis
LEDSETDYLHTYDRILANSSFTASWLRRFWDADSEVLYPPVDTASFVPGEKRPLIFSTGRFFVGEHSKRQDVLVDAFRSLVADGERDWRLHLVGAVGDKPADQAFVANLQAQAKDLPVTFHFNADFATLQELSGQASLYWHAAGYGVNEKKEPLCVEHFGISVVEAMAAGAVPLAVGKGGVREIIESHETGILWNTPEELVAASKRLIRDPDLRARLSAAARQRSHDFSQQRYCEAMQQIVRELEV